jgi:hypothetical protein
MKFTKNTDFRIAKRLLNDVFVKPESLDYKEWVKFIESHPDYFIWYENTKEGKQSLQNIHNVPDDFKEKVLASLNKVRCFVEFNDNKGLYDISVSFYKDLNWITIQFARTPKPDDLRIFTAMAKHLDALLLKDGKEIIDDKVIESLT